MPSRLDIPFNIKIMAITASKVQGIRPVKTLDIMDGNNQNFHPDGLYSTEIFGKQGDPLREQRVSFIDVHVEILHPVIFRGLTSLKRLYGEIMAGTAYAVWDDVAKDFERVNQLDGRTGFFFFLSKWKEINFVETKSDTRQETIKMIRKYMNEALTTRIVVMPAGLRDIELDASGRMQTDEVNDFYKSLIRSSNTVSDIALRSNQEMLNRVRYRLQMTFNDLFEHIESMVEGKKKLLMNKVASRRIFNGTRNVITAMDTTVQYLGAPGSVQFNNTLIGMYQFMKAILPVARYYIRNGFLSHVFTDVGGVVKLINKETLKQEPVQLRSEYYDRWMTDEGVEKIITAFSEESIRHKALEIEGRYVGLLYKGPARTFRLFHDIDELPDQLDRKLVTPVTFAELLYISIYQLTNKYPLFVTRYPVAGNGSIYPSKAYLKTTVRSEKRRELDSEWNLMDEMHVAYEFPLPGESFVDSLSPHSAKLAGLVADFDGDTSSGNATYSDESIAEVENYFGLKRAYVGTDGQFLSSTSVSTVQLVMHNLTVKVDP